MGKQFSIQESKLPEAHNKLLKDFLKYVCETYNLPDHLNDFQIEQVSIGISRSSKVFVQSASTYPYFVKIGEDKNINRENSRYGQAARKIPALSIPPKERFLQDSESGNSLVAFRHVAVGPHTPGATSLFSKMKSLSTYEIMSVIDDLFHVVLFDFHAFRSAEYSVVELKPLDRAAFQDSSNFKLRSELAQMLGQYDAIVRDASSRGIKMPIGQIHGDLHTENILLGKYNNPIVIDFEMSLPHDTLVKDYAEFEVALVYAVVSSSFDESHDEIKAFYEPTYVFGVRGISKISSALSRIRANLYEHASDFAKSNSLPVVDFYRDLSLIYKIFLLRYFCFYSRIATLNSANTAIGYAITVLFKDLFENVQATLQVGARPSA
ncbi:phosphotransferase [Aestuariivirga sp. YIM B02566]|uniref:Phosphotransferase n=1 Tax=Taklimakanibacter albus TaxID=2800327 RepID=A0ACC5RBE6_9HYPH|nr:phosphotransferase [Aestuariivirga sp. YIM B02566]MBK1869940.1 phosphotransferase [Aestuariivirga sp. YIM B02566]